MELKVNISDYDPHDGINLNWEEGYTLEIGYLNGEVVISGNKEGQQRCIDV